MPVGSEGQRRPVDAVASARMVAMVATGLADEQYADAARSESGRKGAKARRDKASTKPAW